MNPLDRLIAFYETFPGVGARQARRFAFHTLMMGKDDVTEFSRTIAGIQDTVIGCTSCRRFFAAQGRESECRICSDSSRDRSKLMVVERDSDVQSIERSGVYDGMYFVLGGTMPLLETKEKKVLRSNGLVHIVTERLSEGLSEVILAFSINPDGENTARYVESVLVEPLNGSTVAITHLGRGLSTGSELEYADPQTIKSALENRG